MIAAKPAENSSMEPGSGMVVDVNLTDAPPVEKLFSTLVPSVLMSKVNRNPFGSEVPNGVDPSAANIPKPKVLPNPDPGGALSTNGPTKVTSNMITAGNVPVFSGYTTD